MFLLRSQMPTHPSQAPHATHPSEHPETAAERTARHLENCRILTDLAMNLAQASAAVAQRELAQPPHPLQPAEPAAPCGTHPASLFTNLSRTAMQAMRLEGRVARDAERRPARPAYRSPNPRRPILARALRQAAAGHPQEAALCEEIDLQVERELAADPEAPIPEIITRICNGFGIHIAPDPGPGFPQRFLYEILDSG